MLGGMRLDSGAGTSTVGGGGSLRVAGAGGLVAVGARARGRMFAPPGPGYCDERPPEPERERGEAMCDDDSIPSLWSIRSGHSANSDTESDVSAMTEAD